MWRSALFSVLMAGFPGMILFCQTPAVKSYPEMPLRIEIPVRSVNETYRVIPCGTNGLIMFFKSQEIADVLHTKWYVACYDTNLQQIWMNSVPLYNDQEYKFYQTGPDTLSLLFVHGGKSKSPENSYEILRVVLKTGSLILNTGTVDDGAVIEAFSVHQGRAWLGVNTKNQAGKIISIRMKEGHSNSFSLGVGGQVSVLWIQPDTASVSLSAIVNRQVSKKNSEYYLVRYDTNGAIRREVKLETQGKGRSLTQVRVAGLNSGAEMILGSFGQGATVSTQKNRSVDASTGLFTSMVNSGSQKTMSFYNFLELQHAASIAGESEFLNLQKKALKKQKPLSEYSLDYSVLLHDILFLNGQYILTSELFAPQFHSENFTDFDFYGRPYTNTYSVFDGYRFYNAVIAGFDQEGKLIWDNLLEIRNLVSTDLSQKVVTYPDGNDLVLCYVSDGKIGSKIIQENRVIEKLDFAVMDMLLPDDKLISESKGALVHWYGNYFLSYGYQDIKNIALESNNKRLVYYFSKVRFEK